MSKTWRFDPGNPDVKTDLLTDGGSPPQGLLAAYPTSMIFIRKLNLQFGDNKGFSNYLATQHSDSQEASGGFSFGPFSFGGGASHFSQNANATQNSGFSHTDQGVSVPGMQVIGFKCHVLTKKAPDPDPKIKNWV